MTFPLLIASYWLYCLLWFVIVQKGLFYAFNRKAAGRRFSRDEYCGVWHHGLRSDAIVASYLTGLPLLIATGFSFFPNADSSLTLSIYSGVIALIVGIGTLSDTILYGFWQSKLDSSVLTYLRSPKGAFASVSYGYLFCAVVGWLLLSALFAAGSILIVCSYCDALTHSPLRWWEYPLIVAMMLLMAGILFMIIRGLKIRPNNPSSAYFSPTPFLNHWALNPIYNFIYSLGVKDEFAKQFQTMSDDDCRKILANTFPTSGKTTKQLLRTERPNVLIVIWESCGAEFTWLTDRADVTPCLTQIAREGIAFTQCTATSFRTDRALPGILCGLPGQPTTSIIRYTRKLPNLPALPRRLRSLGYETTAIHGGDLSIMHKNDFYLSAGHTRLIDENAFPKTEERCKWGVHDGSVIDYLVSDIEEKTKRGVKWLTTLQTLSSHEPFTVPYSRLADKVDNSFAYTDKCIGTMIDRLKNSDAWKDLLIVIVADHGLNRGHIPANRIDNCHIPLVLTGGAITRPDSIDTPMSQTDLAATLLGQMNLTYDEFPFSRNVLSDSYVQSFGFHTFNNGFVMVDNDGATVFDNVANAAVSGANPEREKTAKALLQRLYTYLGEL